MNVMYCVPIGTRGGVERFLEDVIVRHNPRRVAPTVLAFSNGAWLNDLKMRQIKVYCLESMRLRHPYRVFRAVNNILKNERIDLVHSTYPYCHALSAPAALWNRCKQMWFHHGPLSTSRWQGGTSLLPADLVLANSRFLYERLRRTFYIARRTAVLHYGIDVASFQPDEFKRQHFRKEWNIAEDEIAVGLVGFIERWKGQDVLLKAALRLRTHTPRLKIFIIGRPRSGLVEQGCLQFQAELQAFVTEHGLQDMVTFTGHLDVREGALDGLDIFVHSSTEAEPFGMVLLEAMAKKKAIIASAAGGPLEILSTGVDGLLIPPRQPELLADHIGNLADDPDLRRNLGDQAQRTAIERFNADAVTRKLEVYYEELM